jgi:hypothetical protein
MVSFKHLKMLKAGEYEINKRRQQPFTGAVRNLYSMIQTAAKETQTLVPYTRRPKRKTEEMMTSQ